MKRQKDLAVPLGIENSLVLVDDKELKIGDTTAPESGVTLSRLRRRNLSRDVEPIVRALSFKLTANDWLRFKGR